MSSFREVDSPIDYRSSDSNRPEHHHYRPQRYGDRRPLRSNLERQVSDKHLKRRAQIIQLESNSNNHNHNHRFRYLHQHASTTGGSSLSLNDLHHQYDNQYQWHRRSNHGGFFSARNKNESCFTILSVLLIFILILLLVGPTIWYNVQLSGKTETIKMQSIILGGDSNNEYGNVGMNDSNRSYQDLADSIRRLRIRRQILKEETIGELEEKKVTNGDEISYDKGDQYEDDRLQRLEQKIQMEQSIKVREEFLSSHRNDGVDNEHPNTYSSGKSDSRTFEQQSNERQSIDRQPKNGNVAEPDTLKERVMSESIEALKRLNSKNEEESDHNDPVDE